MLRRLRAQLLAVLALACLHACRAASSLVQLHADDFDSVVKNGTETPWFVIFHFPNCPDCAALFREFEELAKLLKGKISLGKVDASESWYLMVDKWQMLDFPKIKLIRGNKAYTYYGNRTAEAMHFFVDPPQYLGWEVSPPEGIPGDIDFSERFRRKRTHLYYIVIHSSMLRAISNIGILGGLLAAVHSCCHCCATLCCSRRKGAGDERTEEDKKK
mmetsp:Transcript_69468/g.203267  ORF Transcript_69468/g.203267 Transcript_69468/m.203267 type:complete len:216 (-) Transcript_69468:132-779(-)